MMYRQTLAQTLSRERPSAEISIADPKDLAREMELFKPDLLVCHDTAPVPCEGVFSRVEILYSDSMDAHVSVKDRVSSRIEDIKLEDMLTIFDETEKLLSSS